MSREDKRIDVEVSSEAKDTPGSGAGEEVAEVPETLSGEQVAEGVLVEHDSLESLQAQLEQALAKADENWNLYLSAQAELQNIRKRAERDLQNAHKFALEKFVNELLPVKDSLEMGIAATAESVDLAKLREGSELTLRILATALEKFGVKEINPVGSRFNPELHEAMAMQPSKQAQPNTVLQVIQKGYLLNDRLVRPAMVIVAKAAENA